MPDSVEVVRRIILPRLPNYVLFADGGKLDVADMTEGDLLKIGEAWTAALIDHALNRSRKQQPKTA